MNSILVGLCLSAVAGLGEVAWAQGAGEPEPQTYMKKLGFASAEIATMESGKAVTRIVPEKDDNEAFVMGVVRIQAPAEALVDGIRKIETFRTTSPTLQIGRFGPTPSLSDIQALSIDDSELEDLRKCRVGNCEIKIGMRALEVAKTVDWKARDAHATASKLIKEAVVQQVKSYLEQGSAAMSVYNDNDVPESVAAEYEKILKNSPNLMRYNPDFYNYLLQFPNGSLPGVENFVYWSKDKVRKPVVSVVHVCIQKVEREGSTGYFIAMKHIYDSHYYLAYAEFLTLVPDGDAARGFFLLDGVRARIDPPRRFRGALLGKIKGAMQDQLGRTLQNTKARLEAAVPNG